MEKREEAAGIKRQGKHVVFYFYFAQTGIIKTLHTINRLVQPNFKSYNACKRILFNISCPYFVYNAKQQTT